tara:strand:- start:2924 stop:3574 length:651 start_codon:yes stop_codon:yes gene_type:complete
VPLSSSNPTHTLDDLVDPYGTKVVPLVGSLAALVRFGLWHKIKSQCVEVKLVPFADVLYFVMEHPHISFIEWLRLFKKAYPDALRKLKKFLIKDNFISIIPTPRGIMGPGHYENLKDIKYINAKGLGNDNNQTWDVENIDLTPHNVFYSLFQHIWDMIKSTEANSNGKVCEYDIKNVVLYSFRTSNMTDTQRLHIQETLALYSETNPDEDRNLFEA